MKAISSSIIVLAGAILIGAGVQHNAYEWAAIVGLVVGAIGLGAWLGYLGFWDWILSGPPQASDNNAESDP
ncbi:hypothetical protein Pla123a_13740 [Posidoniimonas polymericola]|uniref:Uncharacterized protein n=1 Tax=Posidoniimonas polymericola TaxID=2528002 RepID=A0A5C5YUT3_9BACT|nr:hypothetical protein [Posidoniimonas polymericola]TWT78580.1 hypothetical protein Pla123a_13740 [Posidoniimonas polymericola]